MTQRLGTHRHLVRVLYGHDVGWQGAGSEQKGATCNSLPPARAGAQQLRAETDSALRLASVGSPAGRLDVGHAIDKQSGTHKFTAASRHKAERLRHKSELFAVNTALMCII